MISSTLAQRVLAEFVGTAVIVFVAAGTVVSTGGLGALDGSATVTVALAYGLVVAAVMTSAVHLSGAHVNPAVTIGVFVTGRIELRDAGAYLVAQLAGAVAGAGLLRAALPETLWDPVSLGTPQVNEAFGVSTGQGVLIEAVLAFAVAWVFFAAVVDERTAVARAGAWVVGLVVAAGALMAYTFSGAAMNPARAFGPALAGGFWDHHWVFWVGPVAGAIVAAVVYDLAVLRPRDERPATGSTA